MPGIARHLITTADERTWKFGCPVLFLGEWCQLYNRRHIWEKMDFVVAEPYGFDHLQRDIDYEMCRKTENELINIICDVLNEFHGVNHSRRYWRILCGHWLRAYVDLIFNRYRTVQLCLEKYNIGSTVIFDDKKFSLATADTKSFYCASNEDVWNNILYSKLLLLFDSGSIDKTTIDIDSLESITKPAPRKRSSFTQIRLTSIKRKMYSFLQIFSKETDAIITNTYLPYLEEVKLKLALKQVPISYDHPTLCFCSPDLMLRKDLSSPFLTGDKRSYFSCVRNLLFEMIPTCFVEGYKMMSAVVETLDWPCKPRFIFTSNNYMYDEWFKFVTARNIEVNIPYYVGQHGNFGTDKYNYPTVEMLTCDKYVKWGSAISMTQEVPAFVLKLANKKAVLPDTDGGLLFVQDLEGHRIQVWDNTHRYILSMSNNLSFYNGLADKIKRSVVIRLHSARGFFRQYEYERWRDADKDIKIDCCSSLVTALAGSRIVVFSYNSAGFLENLSQNIPTLVLIDDISFIGDIALPYYKDLIDVGILHLSPSSGAQEINLVWDNMDVWWMSPEVQNARKLFCDKFARQSEKPISDLIKILS